MWVEVARKNGKSTLCGGVGLRLGFFDGEAGAEVYAAATKRDQAKIVWGDARRMVLASKALRSRVSVSVGSLFRESDASKFVPLGADADTLDGLNVSGAIVDEVHKHPDRDLLDVLETGTGARTQPLVWMITTAGLAGESVYNAEHDLAEKIVRGETANDSQFVYIATLDPGDDPFDPRVWIKANPNLGVSVREDVIAEDAERAKSSRAFLNSFLRLRMNVRTQQTTRSFDLVEWDRGALPLQIDAARAGGFGGLDLASTQDLTAFVGLYPAADGYLDVVAHFWTPEAGLVDRARKMHAPLEDWVADGWITATPGEVTDYEQVRADVLALAEDYPLREIGYDRWNATGIVAQLSGDGAHMVPIGQGFAGLSAATKELHRLLASGRIRHDGNPVLRWMAGNVSEKTDAAGNVKPDRASSAHKIDGIVALCMAVACYQRNAADPGVSVYEATPDRERESIFL